jgi:hypothetical protein
MGRVGDKGTRRIINIIPQPYSLLIMTNDY